MLSKRNHQEQGTALIFAMIFVLVLSVMGASLMFLSQSETWSSMNYRMMTQARYGAEAGIHAAADYITQTYAQPTATNATDPLSAYTYNGVSPVTVTAGGNPVILSSLSGVTANYPVAAVKTGFNTTSSGSLTAGNNTVNYSASAKLLSMRTIQLCGSPQYVTAQTWLITSHGDITAARNAQVEVSAILEQQYTPCYNYAGFAAGNGCGAISFSGRGTIDSYDSSAYTAGVFQSYDGNLGSNGNLNTAPNTTIDGTFSSPRTGVGNCAAGAPDALTGSTTPTGCESATQVANSTCGSAVIALAQATTFTTPVTDYPLCTGATTAACDATTLAATIPNNGTSLPSPMVPGNYGDIGGNTTITLNPTITVGPPATCGPAVYYINSIVEAGNGKVVVGTCPDGSYQPIIVNIVGSGASPVLDLTGKGLVNSSMSASGIQFLYGGTSPIKLAGNGTSAAVLFAPKSDVTINGNGDWFGSIISNTINNTGNASIHYDRRLSVDLFTVSNWTLDSFTWSKF